MGKEVLVKSIKVVSKQAKYVAELFVHMSPFYFFNINISFEARLLMLLVCETTGIFKISAF